MPHHLVSTDSASVRSNVFGGVGEGVTVLGLEPLSFFR